MIPNPIFWQVIKTVYILLLAAWWLSNPSEKFEGQLGSSFPTEWKSKNVPNHQPVCVCTFWDGLSVIFSFPRC
jgi:hypothetical protein